MGDVWLPNSDRIINIFAFLELTKNTDIDSAAVIIFVKNEFLLGYQENVPESLL